MKITRTWLLRITGGLGFFIIAYSLLRHFTGLSIGEGNEKVLFDIIVFAALGLFVYNRKLAGDEKKEREAKEKTESRQAETPGDTAAEGGDQQS
ncbi:MAG: hypothetical protein LBQ38_11365 [Spirochaetaceae bacterium]|jgi:hypothetical protein|nr:hypothetical protein [Spirochaetaceae bacterium]